MKYFFPFFCLLCSFIPLISQPSNDACANAIALTVNATCSYSTHTNLDATDSGIGNPSCGFYQGADVWFTVVVPASGHLVIDQSAGTLSNTSMAVYTGTCSTLVEYDCDNNSSPNGSMPQILIDDGGLANQTIYVRVWRTNSVNGGTFQICAFEPSIPANIDCGSATALTVGATCSYGTFTNEYAGDSGIGNSSCGFYSGSDVWFSVVVPASGHLVIDQATGTISNTSMAVYTGACGSLVEYDCDNNSSPNGNMPQILIDDGGLANQTIYVRVWRTNSVNGGTFQICAFEPSIPANPDCSSAISLTVSASCSYGTFTNEYAGDSGIGNSSCGFYSGSDVWFSVVVPASGHLVIDQATGTLSNTSMAVYTGACGSLVEYDCDNNSSPNGNMPQILIDDGGLANQTLYVRVWRTNSVNGGTFQICAFEPSIPANPDCSSAISLTVGATCSYSTFTNEYAGDSGAGSTSCGFYQGSDVWFSVVVPATGQLVIDQLQGTLSNTSMAVYTGTCGSLVEYDCDNNSSPNGNMPQILINDGTVANQTLYVRVWRTNSVNGGTFQMCAYEPNIPLNIDCSSATSLAVSNSINFITFTNENAGTSGDATPTCGFYAGTDVWFNMVIPASGQLTLDQTPGTLANTSMAVYTGGCGSLTEYECDNNSSSNGNMPRIDIVDPTLVGQMIYLQVWRTNSVNGGTFGLAAYDPTTFPVEWKSIAAKENKNGVLLSWETATELNSDYFEVERSNDGLMFETLDRVGAAGNASQPVSYQYEDLKPFSGVNYYRLKQVDVNGMFSYSEVVSVRVNAWEDAWKLYPSQVDDVVMIEGVLGERGQIGFKIIDLLGRYYDEQIVEGVPGKNQWKFSVEFLTPGVYQIWILDEKSRKPVTLRFVKD